MMFNSIVFILLLANVLAFRYLEQDDIDSKYNYISEETPDEYEYEILDILGLGHHPHKMSQQSTLKNSASEFLLNVYNEIVEDEENGINKNLRKKRAASDNDLISNMDRVEIEKCNNIITFSSRESPQQLEKTDASIPMNMILNFNMNDVPRDLMLAHSVLRIYQKPAIGKYSTEPERNITLSIYQRNYNEKEHNSSYRIITSINTTTIYNGWLEINMTGLLDEWLQRRTLFQLSNGNDLIVGVTIKELKQNRKIANAINPQDIGLIGVGSTVDIFNFQPFIIAYFNGPDLIAKMQKLRTKRDIPRRKRSPNYYTKRGSAVRGRADFYYEDIYKLPKSCERLNFTLDFKELQMHNWVIAPKKFEAYFCGGECNFPLGAKMNATNHAIVQTLMHLKKPNLPKPCCVPTVLSSISILHYINEDSVNLSKYPQSVARECGCH